MKRKGYTEEQIVYALKQVESGAKVLEICRTMGVSEQTFYRWKKPYGGLGVSELRELRELRDENRKQLGPVRVRFGYRRLHVLLQREGWEVNHKKVYRMHTEEGLIVRTKRRRKIVSRARNPLKQSTELNEQWRLDLVHDRLEDGRTMRMLTVVDNFSLECLALVADTSLSGQKVARCLDRIGKRHGYPQSIRVDNGRADAKC